MILAQAAAVEARRALDASAAADYVVRVVDAADPRDRESEAGLLLAAWLDLYLAVGDRPTTGPRARAMWVD